MYSKENLHFGKTIDSRTENYDEVIGFYLDHSCNEWVIGGVEEAKQLIKDLQELIDKAA